MTDVAGCKARLVGLDDRWFVGDEVAAEEAELEKHLAALERVEANLGYAAEMAQARRPPSLTPP